MQLYEYSRIFDAFRRDCEEGLIPEEARADTWEALQLEAGEKIDNTASYIKGQRAEADELRKEAAVLLKRAREAEDAADYWTRKLADALPRFGYEKKYESPRHKLSLRASKATVIEDVSAFREWAKATNNNDLLTYKDPEPDKNRIKEAIQSGREIFGAYIEERRNLVIK